jgi:hypothetical protein
MTPLVPAGGDLSRTLSVASAVGLAHADAVHDAQGNHRTG